MNQTKRERIIELAKQKFAAGREIVAIVMAGPAKTREEAEESLIRKSLARATYLEAERALEEEINGRK